MSSWSLGQSPLSKRDTLSSTSYRPIQQQDHNQPESSRKASKMAQTTSVPNQGFGLYSYHMPDTLGNYQISTQALITPSTSSSTALPSRRRPNPNILSAEYDPFAPLQSEMTPSYGSALYTMQSIEASKLPVLPSLSIVDSQRSSFSSAPASETYSNPESYHANCDQVKVENHLDWLSQTSGFTRTTASPADYAALSNTPSCFRRSAGGNFLQQQPEVIGWPKSQNLNVDSFPISIERTTPTDADSGMGTKPKEPFSSIARTRMPRKMTTREDANYQCKVKGCGKLFSRSYNFKAHMETHDAGRSYPFPCPFPECNKKFVRKTDLQRHHQSVHMKERNYQCSFCSRYFARKDTLGRHMDDGCSKRFDVDFGFSEQNYPNPNDEIDSSSLQNSYMSNSTSYSSSEIQPSDNDLGTSAIQVQFQEDSSRHGSHWAR